MQANMGMTGEFRCVVKRADGSTKIDTGYQKNLILNQGLDFFGGGNGSDMMAYCVIGSGSSQPSYTQNKLDTAIKGVGGVDFSDKYNYNASTDGGIYKTNKVRKYSFTGLNNVNISEVGLASNYSSSTTYFLCTRALIKDSNGNPTTITVLSGEVLEIYYKLWAVFDTTDKTGTLNLLDGVGGSVAYNWRLRPARVGDKNTYITGTNYNGLGCPVGANYTGGAGQWFYTGEIQGISAEPLNSIDRLSLSLGNYTKDSYKIVINISATVSQINGSIRSILVNTTLGTYQIRFGSVANDSPITKTNTQTLSIPIEFSWGRYEGAL